MTYDVPHPPGRPRSWTDCDEDISQYVGEALAATGLTTTGVYMHGSLAMGCFYRAKSDVDLLVVVPEPLSRAHREHTARVLAERAHARPMLGDLELSVLTERQARSPAREYEVHYSASWTAKILAGEVDYAKTNADPDLAAHLTVVRRRGVTVSGPAPDEVFAAVPAEEYLAAIEADLVDVDLVAEPYYGVLNACRVLMVRELGDVVSKDEGGEWALTALPDHDVRQMSGASVREVRVIAIEAPTTQAMPASCTGASSWLRIR